MGVCVCVCVCVCVSDETMSSMGGCMNYNKLCVKGSKVTGCDTGIPNLITSKEVTSDAYSACKV
jgi:hypothetical protein